MVGETISNDLSLVGVNRVERKRKGEEGKSEGSLGGDRRWRG
jgi:hypothetical protein